MGYKAPRTMTWNLGTAVQDQVDSTTYYFGNLNTSGCSTGENDRSLVAPCNGTVREIFIRADIGTVGTNEDMTLSVRKNSATDYALGTLKADVKGNYLVNRNLAIPMATGDYIQIKEVSPAWATNPLQMRFTGFVVFEYE